MTDILKIKINDDWVGIPAIKGEPGQDGENGIGIPAGGSTGQALVKKSNTNYDTEFQTLTASDVGALPANTIIPAKTSDLTNDSNFITSSALTDYQLKAQPVTTLSSSGTIALADNSINKITPSGNITFTLPTVTDTSVFHQIMVQVHLTTVYTITLGTSYYFDKTSPDLSATGDYNLIFEYDIANSHWVVGSIAKGAAS